MKKNSITYSLTFLLVLGFGALMFERGFFWAKEQKDVLDDSDFYLALHHIMPIWMWGIIVMFAGVLVMISAFCVGSSDQNTHFSKLLLVGGFASALLYFLMTSASIYHAINWLTTAHMALMSATGFLMAFIGGADVYARRG